MKNDGLIDLTGKKFGMWSVLEYAGKQKWKCRCDCGIVRDVVSSGLRYGKSLSCGAHKKNNLRHGMAYSREWRIWASMKARCGNPNNKAFDQYGARGIRVCDRWLESFDNFIADMGPRPSDKHSIERKDNDGNYEPGNCKWATQKEQCRNKRNNRTLWFRGRKITLAEFSEMIPMRASTIWRRLMLGWTPEEIASVPVRQFKRAS